MAAGKGNSGSPERLGMKRCVGLVIVLAAMPAMLALGGSEQIIKQRARELSNQNNVRQGVQAPAPATPGAVAPATAAPAQPLTPQQQALARL